MAGLNVVSFRPERSDYAWTFGGVDPVMKVKPGDVLEVWTDDCFGGLVESVDDLPSKKITVVIYVTQAPKGNPLAAYASAIYNRIGRLLAPASPPNLPVCPRPPG